MGHAEAQHRQAARQHEREEYWAQEEELSKAPARPKTRTGGMLRNQSDPGLSPKDRVKDQSDRLYGDHIRREEGKMKSQLQREQVYVQTKKLKEKELKAKHA